MNRFGIYKEKQTTYPFQTSWTTFVSTQFIKLTDSFKPVVFQSLQVYYRGRVLSWGEQWSLKLYQLNC